jgi:integrase
MTDVRQIGRGGERAVDSRHADRLDPRDRDEPRGPFAAAGPRDFHFHDLRHHGATMALNKGFSPPIVMALDGWKTEAIMRRYAAVTDQTLRAAAEAVSGNEP